MYDKLMEKIKDLIPESRSNTQYYTAKVLEEAADAIMELSDKLAIAEEDKIKLFCQIPCWIPVTERLPEKDGCYLVAVKNDHQRRYSKTAWFSHDSWFARQDVTHWMPLPQSPEEENK